jgi:hypothetical protein
MSLRQKEVVGLKYYRESDWESFSLFFRLLKDNDYYVSLSQRRVELYFPDFQKIFWRVEERALPSIGLRKREINGSALVHQAMHSLIGFRYGTRYESHPWLTLLSEAAAGATELYFELQHCRHHGVDLQSPLLKRYAENAKDTGTPLIPVFNQGIRSPFKIYRKTVHDYFETCLKLLEVYHSFQSGIRRSDRELIRFLEKKKTLVFFRHKDFANFMQFVAAKCGLRASERDKERVAACLRELDQSSSMSEFITRLTAETGKGEQKPEIVIAA